MGLIDMQPEVISNPKEGKKVFNAFIKILETQQLQLEALADERNRQEEQIKIVYERWISGVRSLKDIIEQLRRQTKLSEMARFVEAAKTKVVFGLKMKQELVYKHKLDNTEDELSDFREWFDILCHRCPTDKDVSPDKLNDTIEESGSENGSTKSASTKKALEKEVRKLKCEYEKLSVKNSSEVSALMSEKEFVCNQFAEMENRYTIQLKEKDEQIADLKASLENMEAEASKKDEQISKMLEELKSLKKSNSELLTPVRPCSAKRGAKASSSSGRHERKRKISSSLTRFGTAETKAKADKSSSKSMKRMSSSQQVEVCSSKSMKRMSSSQQVETNSRGKSNEHETPKLFSSEFKIPKLKNLSLNQYDS